jgi:hypothetical protein
MGAAMVSLIAVCSFIAGFVSFPIVVLILLICASRIERSPRIEAGAKRRPADEYDAAQERGLFLQILLRLLVVDALDD